MQRMHRDGFTWIKRNEGLFFILQLQSEVSDALVKTSSGVLLLSNQLKESQT